MGVKNLWRLLLPISRRISIQSLSHQTLAIDASIWLTQISKACRDSETGRLLPNRPHVRIFLLRLMRLLFHEIKPVVVFDGVMPEVKRREIQRRKDRREKLWRDDDDEADGAMGGGAMRRTAKKILVQRLKELRKKEAVAGFDDSKNAKQEQPNDMSGTGAFVAGFNTGDSTGDDQSTKSEANSSPGMQKGDTNKQVDDEVISIHSEEELQQPPPMNNDSDSDNDWEMSHDVQSSINNSLAQQQLTFSTDDHIDQPNETIASLPTITRTQWIDSQFRAQRIQSRQECISVAADMNEYSSTQLRNFLKGSRLNKRMNEIGVLAGKMAQEGDGGRVTSSSVENVSMQVLFGEDNSGDDQSNEGAQPVQSNLGTKAENGRDGEVDGSSGEGVELSGCSEEGAGRKDDEESRGGFLLPSSDPNPTIPTSMEWESDTNDAIYLRDSDEGSNSGKEQSRAAAEGKEIINNIDSSANNTAAERLSKNPSSNLLAFASAKEWEDWGKGDSDSEKDTKNYSTVRAKSPQLNSQHYDTDSSDETKTTFLTLGNGCQANNLTGKLTDTNKTKEIHSACQTLPVTAKAEENESEYMESVEWEDGNSSDDVELSEEHHEANKAIGCPDVGASVTTVKALESTIGEPRDNTMTNHSLYDTIHDKVRPIGSETANEIIEIQSDDEICWEDGSTASKVYVQEGDDVVCLEEDEASPKNTNDKAVESKEESAAITFEEGIDASTFQRDTNIANSDEKVQPPSQHEDLSDDVCDEELYANEFNVPQPENPNIAALQHAQETASKLTDWAGRAVQRAFAAHLDQHKEQTSPQELKEAKSSNIDLTGPKNDIASSETDRAAKKPENQTKQRHVEFLDTSLEGLNAAHHAIFEEEKTMERDMSTITDEMKEDILKLLELCGIPWIESPAEAEAQCAALEELGLVDGIVTEDSDVFVFGGRKVYKNFFNEQQYVEAYYARDAQKELGLGKNELVKLAMLLGSDYTDGVRGVGIVNGMEILQAFPSDDIRKGLQAFREWLDGFGEPPATNEDGEETTYLTRQMLFHKKHKSARTRWVAPADFPSHVIINAYAKPAVDKSNSKFTWAKPRIDGLQQFCAETLGWDQEETDRVVLPVLKVLESKSKQRRLESYFMKYDDGIKFAEVRSKRLKAVLEGVQDREQHRQAQDNNGSSPGNDSSIKRRKK